MKTPTNESLRGKPVYIEWVDPHPIDIFQSQGLSLVWNYFYLDDIYYHPTPKDENLTLTVRNYPNDNEPGVISINTSMVKFMIVDTKVDNNALY